MGKWKVYIGWAEQRGSEAVVVEEYYSEHETYLEARKAALDYLSGWAGDPAASRYPAQFRIDGDYLSLWRGGN